MSELREAAQAALTAYETYRDVDDIDGLDDAMDRLRAALVRPKTELRDQHKAFTHWYFGLRGTNEANFSPEDLAWAAWKAALAQHVTEVVAGERVTVLDEVLRGLRSERDTDQLRAIIAEVEAIRARSTK